MSYEITKIFSNNEVQELNESVLDSFEHVERVLAFSNIMTVEYEESDEIWSALQVALDSSSYYACLALPLIRQLIEQNCMPYSIDTGYRNIRVNFQSSQQPKQFISLNDKQRELADEIWGLACRINELRSRYLKISCARDLAEWSGYFLECSANLILLAVKISKWNEQ